MTAIQNLDHSLTCALPIIVDDDANLGVNVPWAVVNPMRRIEQSKLTISVVKTPSRIFANWQGEHAKTILWLPTVEMKAESMELNLLQSLPPAITHKSRFSEK